MQALQGVGCGSNLRGVFQRRLAMRLQQLRENGQAVEALCRLKFRSQLCRVLSVVLSDGGSVRERCKQQDQTKPSGARPPATKAPHSDSPSERFEEV